MDTAPATDDIDFDDGGLAACLDRLDAAALDRLPFGVIRVGPDGTVVRYSRTEAVQSGMGDRSPLGLPFFAGVAPCMDSPLVRGRIEQALAGGTLDLRLRHTGDFGDRGRTLELRAVSARGGGFWLCLRRR